jgi:hypothetical protein
VTERWMRVRSDNELKIRVSAVPAALAAWRDSPLRKIVRSARTI